MKRFTETTKWDDPWFRKLSPTAKCLWTYLCERCDAAGVIDLDMELASFLIGTKIKTEHIGELGSRIVQLDNGKWWITKFIQFQYGSLSEDCRGHAQAIKAYRENGLEERVSKGFENPFGRDKDRTGLGQEEGVQGEIFPAEEIPAVLQTPEFVEAWRQWKCFRREIRKKLTPRTASEQLKTLAQIGVESAILTIQTSIRNQWQGLFPPRSTVPAQANGRKPYVPNI